VISTEFAKATRVVERCYERMHRIWTCTRDVGLLHTLNFSMDLLPAAFDVHDQLAARCGLEARHPYADVRLVNYCLSLPLKYKLMTPLPKLVMRTAMQGILPENVRRRVIHRHPAPAFLDVFWREDFPGSEAVLRKSLTGLDGYVNLDAVTLLWKRAGAGSASDSWNLWNVLGLSAWLTAVRRDR
jgi:asparagine synthase (glutamine-hydrolysing)